MKKTKTHHKKIAWKTVVIALIVFAVGATPNSIDRFDAPPAKKLFELHPSYLLPGGAIATHPGVTDAVDPYFPTKALLLAHDAGYDISKLALRWIDWMLPRQYINGLFPRFCLNPQQQYDPCAVADADDSMMALWIELLYRMAPSSGMPIAWQESVEKAEMQLELLHEPTKNIYYLSRAMPVGLFMDNVEVYAAYKSAEKDARRMGHERKAEVFSTKSQWLKKGMMETFWDAEKHEFIASTQTERELSFYPDGIVQVIPLIYASRLPFAPVENRAYKNWRERFYRQWLNMHGDTWFATLGKDYPWGLLAVLATERGDMKTAHCWLQITAKHRGITYWNVLDEAAFQVVEGRLKEKPFRTEPDCQKAN